MFVAGGLGNNFVMHDDVPFYCELLEFLFAVLNF